MFFDFSELNQINFQDTAAPIAEAIADLHHNIFSVILVISIVVIYLLASLIWKWRFGWEKPNEESLLRNSDYLQTVNLVHSPILETVWTVIPSIILMIIAVPSFALLYAMDEVLEPDFTVKCIGHQWYWEYELGMIETHTEEAKTLAYDSYMITESDLSEASNRLLEVDTPLIVPAYKQVRFVVSSIDVLHAFSVNSLGVKVDAVPGRLNQVAAFIKRAGTFYGQCSELCGTNHAFMPIVVKAYVPAKWEELTNLLRNDTELAVAFPDYKGAR